MIHADRKEGRGGGVALYIHKNFNDYKIRKDIHIQGAEDNFIEITNDSGKNILVGTVYRPPCNNITYFLENLDNSLEQISRENKHIYLMGDYNIDLTSSVHLKNPNTSAHENNCTNNNKFLDILSTYALSPCISKPTRITPTSSTLIDNIFTNTINKDSLSGVFYYDISDHLPIFLISMQLRSNNKIKAKTMTHSKESIENIAALKSELEKEHSL